MLYEQTISKLTAMKLTGMITALEEQRQQAESSGISFEERLALLVERQWLWKENRALKTRLYQAQLKHRNACIENINYRHSRNLEKDRIEQMLGSDWIGNGKSCVITGPTGTGKSYLACALGKRGCIDGYRVCYYYAPKLFRDLHQSRLDGSLSRLLNRLEKKQLLIVDDLGLETVSVEAYRLFLEVLDDRHGNHATLIASQYAVSTWHELIKDETVADAICDRLIHGSYRIELSGESMRKLSTVRNDE